MADTFVSVTWVADELVTSTKLNQAMANQANFHNGTALGDGIIVTRHFSSSQVTTPKIDWSTFDKNIKSASNTSAITPTNFINNNLESYGAKIQFTVSGSAYALAIVSVGISSASDFENKPLVYLDGSHFNTYEIAAAPGNGSARIFQRINHMNIPLSTGSHTISAGVFISSATSPYIPIGNARITVLVFGNVTA